MSSNRLCFRALVLATFYLSSIIVHAQGDSKPKGIDWQAGQKTTPGIDQPGLDSLYKDMTVEQHGDLKAIVIVRDGHLVSEHYFNGDSIATLHDIRSATKSITSLAMGLAIEKHLVQSVDDSIADYLPGLPKDGKEKIKIKDLLNMRSGLEADDTDPSTAGDEDRLEDSSDWIRSAYAVPVKRAPGEAYLYCSLNAFLTGAMVENVSRMHLDDFVKKNLFDPLGIQDYLWRRVPVDRTTGQGNLSITARDAAAIGQLMLNDGRVNDRRIVSHDWIERSLAEQVSYADFYGYMWYSKDEPVGDRKILVHFASGNGGNKIYIVPSRHMVIAITSSAYNTKWGQRRSQDILLRILAAVHPA